MKCTNFSPGDTNDPQIQTNHPTPLFAPKDITLIRHSLALYDNEDNEKKMTTKKNSVKDLASMKTKTTKTTMPGKDDANNSKNKMQLNLVTDKNATIHQGGVN